MSCTLRYWCACHAPPHLIADDKDKSGKLQFPEFLSLARALIGTRKVCGKQTAA